VKLVPTSHTHFHLFDDHLWSQWHLGLYCRICCIIYSSVLFCVDWIFNSFLVPSFFSHGVRLSPLGTAATVWPIVPAQMIRWWWLWGNWWIANWQGKLKYSEKTCPGAILSTTNPIWPGPGSNLGYCSGKPATNRLSYGKATFILNKSSLEHLIRFCLCLLFSCSSLISLLQS
jgi:hypothetical protein